MVLGNNEIQFIKYEDIGASSLLGPIIFFDYGKGDLKDEKSRGSMSRNTGQDQLSFLGTPGTLMQNFDSALHVQ